MTTPQQLLAPRRRRQILNDEVLKPFEPGKPEPEGDLVTYFVSQLVRLRDQMLRLVRSFAW